jgi:hypothetical protein
MHNQQSTVYRGLYGPHPAVLIASAQLWRRAAAWSAALFHRVASIGRSSRLAPVSPGERIWPGVRQLRFRPLIPEQAPRGYRLVAIDVVPGCADLLTTVYRAANGNSFGVSQRPQWLPLGEELRLARVPATAVRCGSLRMFVVHGVYTGEPIDHAYSTRYRRSLAIELGELVVELREVMGRGPGLRGLIAMAAAMAEQVARAEWLEDHAGADVVAPTLPALVQS